ncbi:MAG: M28 family peptidase [Bacteroidetes bacterium]|nr:M28 family peptidase [Bacteroidota bacterium]
MKKTLLSLSILLLLASCDTCNNKTTTPAEPNKQITVNAPTFSSDTAYSYIQAQVNFGPRAMNTTAHEKCAAFLIQEAERFADTVYVQHFNARGYDGTVLKSTNIVAAFNPQATTRVLLCSHWDSRPWADQDDSASTAPILAANDGASGVGVLLEIARLLKASPLKNIGVDVFFIDTEDYGKPGYENSYCLGAQHWAANPHVPGYKADFGILLDMVGAPNAVFAREGNSTFHAGWVQDVVWGNAAELGFGNFFSNERIGAITDDHLYINNLIKIPTIDIIQYDPASSSGTFGEYWHTHDDDMDVIDKATLHAVGATVTHTLYKYEAEQTPLP